MSPRADDLRAGACNRERISILACRANSAARAGPAVGDRAGGLIHADVIDEVEARVAGPADRATATAVEAVGNGAAGHAAEICGEVVQIDAEEALAERIAAAAAVGGAI